MRGFDRAKDNLDSAAAGADVVAPSDMMDGRVGALRQALRAVELDNLDANDVTIWVSSRKPVTRLPSCTPAV